jgi:uncharacterized protein YlxW (UPF0749 family)
MNKKIITITCVLFILGIILSMQFKTQQQLLNTLEYQDARDLITIYHSMKEKQEELLLTVQELRNRKLTMAEETTKGMELIKHTEEEIKQLQVINGELAISGPGITVTITRDAPLLHYDLLDLINELWSSGAEAIAINDHRITLNTYIQQFAPDEILINNEKLLFPCVVKAIGDPNTLEKGLTFSGGLIDNWKILYGIYPSITTRESIEIPATK